MAAAERRTMRYADVARIIGINPKGQSMGVRVGSLLDEICEDEVRVANPMLSALVVGYTGRPGAGFFGTAQALGRLRGGDDEAAFWAQKLEAVYGTWRPPSRSPRERGGSATGKNMTHERLLASAGDAAPPIRALLALDGEQGIGLIPKPRCLSMRVDVGGDQVPILNIFATGVHFSPDFPCLYVDGNVLRSRRGQQFLDLVRARLADSGSWRLMPVDMQCVLDRTYSEDEIDEAVTFLRWLRDRISETGVPGSVSPSTADTLPTRRLTTT
jgi:hypothetical protein